MEQIDALGEKCPTPLIRTKRLLDSLTEGTVCTLVDDEVAVPNLMDYAKSQGFAARYETAGEGRWRVFTEKTAQSRAQQKQAEQLAILVTSRSLGGGEEAQGRALMQESLRAFAEGEPRPDSLIFMNSGVFLNTEDSPLEEMLFALEAAGTDIITCGTCLDFYGVKENLLTGRIGNMYTIAEKLCDAQKNVYLQ